YRLSHPIDALCKVAIREEFRSCQSVPSTRSTIPPPLPVAPWHSASTVRTRSSGNERRHLHHARRPHGTVAFGINAAGQIVGYYTDNNGDHGFLYDPNRGVFPPYFTLDDPLANNFTIAQGINSSGQIVGYYQNASGLHGFLLSGGIYTT